MSVDVDRGDRWAVAARLRTARDDQVVRVMAMVFVVSQVLDAATTEVALRSGRFTEVNPLFAPAMGHHLDGAVLVKILVALGVLAISVAALAAGRRRLVLAVLAGISLQAPLLNLAHMAGLG